MSFYATKWIWQPSTEINDGGHPISIEECPQVDGNVLYAIRQMGWVMDGEGNWEMEPMPSSRDDKFMKKFRFDSWEDAALAIKKKCKPNGRVHIF